MASAVFHGRNAREYQNKFAGLTSLITLIGALGLIISCGKHSISNGSNGLKHNVDEPVRSTEKWQWYELKNAEDEARYLDFQGVVLGEKEITFFRPDDPFAARVQAWVDKYDAALRKKYPEQLANVPSPKALVKFDANPNAYVTPMPVCLNLRVELNPKASDDLEFPSVLVNANGSVEPILAAGSCAERHVNLEEARSFASWVRREFSSCQVKVEETDEQQFKLVLGEGCQVKAPLSEFKSAKKLVYMPTVNRLNVHSGMSLIMNEESFSAALAHELGHYYRAHPTTKTSGNNYNFFYKLEAKNHDHAPKFDPSVQELGKEVQNVFLPSRKYRKVPEQKFRSELFPALLVLPQYVATIQDCSDGKPCNGACTEFTEFIKDEAVSEAVGGFPVEKLSEEGTKMYFDIEKRADACLKNLKVSEDATLVFKGEALPAEAVKGALTFDPRLASVFKDFVPEESVYAAFERASQAIDAATEKSKNVLAKAKDLPLGYYTVEQEADELAVEWLSEVGVDPINAVVSDLVLTKLSEVLDELTHSEDKGFPFTVGSERCMALYLNGWKDENGENFFVPIADYEDPHHSTCYRAFNVSREIEAHKFVANPNAPAFTPPTADTWEDLRNAIIEMHTKPDESKVEKRKVGSHGMQEAFFFLKDELQPKACAYFGNKAHDHSAH